MNDETRNADEDEAEAGGEPGKDGRESSDRDSPGRILQAARKHKGLSIDELATQTLLSRDSLTALEADDFERLSQPVYVRGYYRKCAKILDLPEDELMAAYAAHAGVPGPRPVPPAQLDVIPQDVTPHGWRGLGLILAVLAVLMLLAAAWWLK